MCTLTTHFGIEVMGIADLIGSFISTPGRVFKYVETNVLRSPRSSKRPRKDSTDGGEDDERSARLKQSLPEAETKTASRLAKVSGNTPRYKSEGRIAAGEVVSPPAPGLRRHLHKQGQAPLQGTTPGEVGAERFPYKRRKKAEAVPAESLQLWGSIRDRRHGPQTGFKPFHSTGAPAQLAGSPMMVRHMSMS